MTTLTPYNNAFDWGTFPTAADLPNVSGSATQSPDVRIGARAYAISGGAYVCSVPTPGAAVWVTAGTGTDASDIAYTPTTPSDWPNPDPTDVQEAADQLADRVTTLEGSLRTVVGPMTATTAVGSVPVLYAGGVLVAQRAGTITVISGSLSVAAADDTIVLGAVINGAPCTGSVTFADGGSQFGFANVTASNTFVAGDTIYAAAVGGASLSNTPALVASIEVTYA